MTPLRRALSRFEVRWALASAALGLPALALSLILLWRSGLGAGARWGIALLLIGISAFGAVALGRRLEYSLNTLATLLEALEKGDFSIRAHGSGSGGGHDALLREINALGTTLREQRWGALEATALLRRVMEEIDVAVFAFDTDHRLRLTNRSGERLLARPSRRLLGRTVEELGLEDCLAGPTDRTVERSFPDRMGRWAVRRSTFREQGRPHTLLVVADLSLALREEERRSYRRLIRTLGHELNNSLTPIRSMAATLRSLLAREPAPPDLDEDLRRGLHTIEERSAALARFVAAASRLARLPPPSPRVVELAPLVDRVAELESAGRVEVVGGPEVELDADPEQLELLLANLVRNAIESLEADARSSEGGVRVGWALHDSTLEIWVEDDGPGPPESADAFVPFFTTKPQGTGIGLALGRQIAEAHGGAIELLRAPSGGCRAVVRLQREGDGESDRGTPGEAR